MSLYGYDREREREKPTLSFVVSKMCAIPMDEKNMVVGPVP